MAKPIERPVVPAEVRAVIERAWGSAAAAALDDVDGLGSPLACGNTPELPWPQVLHLAVPRSFHRPLFFIDDEWQQRTGIEAFRALIVGVRPTVADAAAIHSAFELLVGARVVRDEAELERLLSLAPQQGWAEQPEPAPPETRDCFEPPFVEGGRAMFQANCRFWERGPSWLRLTVDTRSCTVEVEQLGDGAVEGVRFFLRGRSYDGVLAAATSHGVRSRWAEAARAEHASIASFARATVELMALGAPLSLLSRMQQAALDEVEHTRLSLELARTKDGVEVELGPLPALPPRNASHADVARATLLDAAVPETIAVAEALADADRSVDDDERAAYRRIAREEAEHAALAWDIVAWCLEHDGDGAVRAALTPLVDEIERLDPASAERLRVLVVA